MKRRDSFKVLLGAAAISTMNFKANSMQLKNNIIKPKKLKAGDTIGVIAPGSNASSPYDLMRAEEIAKLLNLNILFGNNLLKGDGVKTRTAKERLDDLHEMFDDKKIDAVVAIRGGYGSAQLLPDIDYKLIKNNPKVFLGYSDITALHISIHKNTGLITFHGPLLLSSFTEWTFNNLKKVIMDDSEIGNLSNPDKKSGIRKMFPARTIVKGNATGEITGGNLSIISSLMGTPYEIDTQNKILIIEDVGEAPYKIDRMLTQLKLAGKLRVANGIIFGKCTGCEPDDSRSTWDLELSQVIDKIFKSIGKPCFSGFMFGHTKDQLTIPIGINADMNADTGILSINESAVI